MSDDIDGGLLAAQPYLADFLGRGKGPMTDRRSTP
jgi:hypothetical protein